MSQLPGQPSTKRVRVERELGLYWGRIRHDKKQIEDPETVAIYLIQPKSCNSPLGSHLKVISDRVLQSSPLAELIEAASDKNSRPVDCVSSDRALWVGCWLQLVVDGIERYPARQSQPRESIRYWPHRMCRTNIRTIVLEILSRDSFRIGSLPINLL